MWNVRVEDEADSSIFMDGHLPLGHPRFFMYRDFIMLYVST